MKRGSANPAHAKSATQSKKKKIPASNQNPQVNHASSTGSSSPREVFAFGVASPIDRQEQLLRSGYQADVAFKVGSSGQLIHAHKLILTVASEVFYAQFNGDFDEARNDSLQNPIVVEDSEPEIFNQVLRFIYSQKVDLSPENVADIYCLAEMYLLTGLKTVCDNFLKTTLNVKNVLKVFDSNRRYGFDTVDKLCLNIIWDNPIACFQNPDFLTLCQSAVELIAASLTMNCQKDQLCTAIDKWQKSNGSEADIKPKLEALQCGKLSAFSTFRYASEISSDFKIKVKGTMHLYGLGVFIGADPSMPMPLSIIKVTVKVEPCNLTVSRAVRVRKDLYVEEIMFEKLTVTDECRITVKLPNVSLFCLDEFRPVDTLGILKLTVTDMKATAARSDPYGCYAQPKPNYTNCVAYLLYNL